MIYLTGIILCSGFVLVASLCCRDGTWSGTHGESQWTIAFLTGFLHLVGAPLPFLGESDHPIKQRDGGYIIDFASDICA
jgi:hypothetical protein